MCKRYESAPTEQTSAAPPGPDKIEADAILTDDRDQTPAPRSRRRTIADDAISLLNQAVAWVHVTPRRRFAVYGLGGFGVAALIVGLRFGTDLMSLSGEFSDFLARPAEHGAQAEASGVVSAGAPAKIAAATPPAEDAFAKIPAELLAELTKPANASGASFGRAFDGKPEDLCASLAALGVTGAHLAANPLAPDAWTCDSDLVVFGKPGADVTPSSIFVSLRGAHADRIDLLRLKLNLTDPKTADAARSALLRTLQGLHANLGWDEPAAVVEAVKRMQDARISHFGLLYDIRREWSAPPRLDVIVTTAGNTGIVPIDAFAVPHDGKRSPLSPASSSGTKPPSAGAVEAELQVPADEAAAGSRPIENIAR